MEVEAGEPGLVTKPLYNGIENIGDDSRDAERNDQAAKTISRVDSAGYHQDAPPEPDYQSPDY